MPPIQVVVRAAATARAGGAGTGANYIAGAGHTACARVRTADRRPSRCCSGIVKPCTGRQLAFFLFAETSVIVTGEATHQSVASWWIATGVILKD